MSLDAFFAALTTTRIALPIQGYSSNASELEDLDNNPVYGWEGIKTTQSVGIGLPVVYGTHGVGGNIINAVVESGESETLNLLIALCEGEVDSISNIKINGNPIENYYGDPAGDPYGKNIEISKRYGTNDQSVIEEFGDLHDVHSVNQQLDKDAPYDYTTTGIDIEGFKLSFKLDKCYQKDAEGNHFAWEVHYRVQYRVNGAASWETIGDFKINKKTKSNVFFNYKSGRFSANKYDIRVTRIYNAPDSDHFGVLTLTSVDEIRTQDLNYPNTALLGLKLLATDKISKNMPSISCMIRGRKVRIPKVLYGGEVADWDDYYWDPSTSNFRMRYNNAPCVWDGYHEAYSGNPVWCLRDLLINDRYGLGEFISDSDLDYASFLAAAKYCEEKIENADGQFEKRMSLDMVVNTESRAIDVINFIAKTFRGLVYYSEGKVRVKVEADESAVQLFTVGNILKDSFNLQYFPKKAIPNILECSFPNKNKDYQMDTLQIGDESAISAGEKPRIRKIQFAGVTRASQVLREGKILLNLFKNNTTAISFRAYTDALVAQVGDVIEFQHDVTQWGFGGRVQTGSTSSKVKLGKSITIGSNYKIKVRDNDTDTIEEQDVSDAPGTYTELNVTSPFSFTPSAYDVWAVGSPTSRKYRISGIKKLDSGVSEISAVEYTDGVYDAGAIILSDDEYSHLTLEIPDVTNLVADERSTRLNDGSIQTSIDVSFTKPSTSDRWIKKVVSFDIYISDDNGSSWDFIANTDKELFKITDDIGVGNTYRIVVVSVTDTGEKNPISSSPYDTITLVGWTGYPSNVTGLSSSFTDEIVFKWNKIIDEDLAYYEIRTEDADWGQDDADLVWRGKAEKFILVTPSARAGVVYYIKAANTSRIFSQTATSIHPTNPAPPSPSVTITELFQKVFLMWTDAGDADLQYYEVQRSNTGSWSGEEELVHKSSGTSAVCEVPYSITYFRVRGVDTYGAGTWSNTVQVDQVQIGSGDIAANVIVASHITAGAINACHIGANQVTAEKIDVDCLSAISANMGCLTAGCIIGGCIKTGLNPEHTALNCCGLFSYDVCGCLRTKLVNGELCLIDPQCSDCYSFLSSGALHFHHPWGVIPYAKRICSGTSCTGDTVQLNQWYCMPEIIVGIEKLASYVCDAAGFSQEWCVYYDNLAQYDNGGGDFGWQFDVHSCLLVEGGIRPECVHNVEFGMCVCTGANTCKVLVKDQYQLWTHATAPANYCYGVICYEIRYRCLGCGVWCGCCYTFIMPHGSVTQMYCTQTTCHEICLPCAAQWELSKYQVCFEWCDSGIPSGECLLCLCSRCTSTSNHHFEWVCTPTMPYSTSCCLCTPLSFGGGSPTCIFCQYICWCLMASSFYGFAYATIISSNTSTNACTCFGSLYHSDSASVSGPPAACDLFNTPGAWNCCQDITGGGIPGMAHITCGDSSTWLSVCFHYSTEYRINITTQAVAYLHQCYYVFCGGAATCCHRKLFSVTDTRDVQCILDACGRLHWLAIAYS